MLLVVLNFPHLMGPPVTIKIRQNDRVRFWILRALVIPLDAAWPLWAGSTLVSCNSEVFGHFYDDFSLGGRLGRRLARAAVKRSADDPIGCSMVNIVRNHPGFMHF